mgnify:CR=1 FL=1
MFGLTTTKKHTIDLELLGKTVDSLRKEVGSLKSAMSRTRNQKAGASTPAEPKHNKKKSKHKFTYKKYEPLLYAFLLEKGGMRLQKIRTFYKSPAKGMPHSTLHRMIDISPRIRKDRSKGKGAVWAVAIPQNDNTMKITFPNADQKSDGRRKGNGYSMSKEAVYKREYRAKKIAVTDHLRHSTQPTYGVAISGLIRQREGKNKGVPVHRMDCSKAVSAAETMLVANDISVLKIKAALVFATGTPSLTVCSYCKKSKRLLTV